LVPTTDMTERQLDVLIAGIGLLYGGSSPRKRKRLLRPRILGIASFRIRRTWLRR
jgi:hypothetical protein